MLHAAKAADGESAGEEPVKHFYSSKPALLPTLIAGIIYPRGSQRAFRSTGSCSRSGPSAGHKRRIPILPTRSRGCSRRRRSPVKWPAYVFYFKPILVLLNVIPYRVVSGLVRAPARPVRGRRLDLVFLPGCRGLRHVSLAIYVRR